ncbi:DUF6879 family protein [Amycolatopsis sp. NPDC059027]|uniref:DUF6879 family protein n=1 Tax=unclassified Amycolatopsis TaxID=2618356 RepID=UPI00366E6EA5
MSLSNEEVSALFREFKRSAFRLETLQTYTIPSEQASFQRFLAGKPQLEGYGKAWHELIQNHVEAGRSVQRAKIVRRPLTDYSRYLLSWGVPANINAGEDYQILDLTDRTVDLPEQDFWLFDDETVLLLNFNPDGTLRDRALADAADLDQYRRWRDLALSEAVPWSEYRPE